ncbi:hypothetical protein QBC44DRAFT_262235 [Cladorrhinum sp. PSN332]|nr:hypothetical protein QBC44DRAFT_262235 [Cladorrhinum sp. PSN332]
MVIQFQDAPLILVMGSSGSGKTRFVNYLMPNSDDDEPNPESGSSNIQIAPVRFGDKLVYVADTPGFDHGHSASKNLEDMTLFLGRQYESGCKLRGIVFLHQITELELQGAGLTHFHMFQEMCGEDAFKNVVLLTTKWDEVDVGVGSRRHLELKDEFWGPMIRHGGQARRFHPASTSLAEALICRLLDKQDVVLKIQKEVMEEGKHLDETAAGHLVVRGIDHRLDGLTNEIKQLMKDSELAAGFGNNGRLEETQNDLSRARASEQDMMAARRRLQRDMQGIIREEIREEKSKADSGRGIRIFSSLVRLTISTTTDYILPLLGVDVL